jgi:predicted porin
MNKKLIAAAIAAAIAAPTAALANDVTIYGVAHLSIDYLDTDALSNDGFDVVSRASRLGFKGTEDLANGLKAIWKMEFQVDMGDAGNQAEGSFSRYTGGRDGYVLDGSSRWDTVVDLNEIAAVGLTGAPGSGACIETTALSPTPTSSYATVGVNPSCVSNLGVAVIEQVDSNGVGTGVYEAAVVLDGTVVRGTREIAEVTTLAALYSGTRGSPTVSQGRFTGIIAPQSDLVTARNMYVGLSGGWGTFLVGRHDTPYKMSTGKLDLFADELGDYNSLIGFQDIRTGSAIAYVSPSWSGLSFAAATVAPHLYDNVSGTDADSLNGAWSLALTYDNYGFFASAAYEVLTEDWLEAWAGQTTGLNLSEAIANDDTKWRVGLGWTGAGFTIGGLYEQQSAILGVDGFDADRWQIQAGYTFGNNMVKASYGQESFDTNIAGLAPDVDAWAIGFDHNLSKRTKVYIQYVDRSVDDDDSFDISGGSVGMVHKF